MEEKIIERVNEGILAIAEREVREEMRGGEGERRRGEGTSLIFRRKRNWMLRFLIWRTWTKMTSRS